MRNGLFVLCLLALAGGAEEERVTYHFVDESAARVAEVLTNYYGATVQLDAEYAARQLSLHLSNLPFQTVLERFAQRMGAVVYRPTKAEIFVLPEWKRDLTVKLAEAPVRDVMWKADDITLHGAIAYLRSVTGANFAFDPEVRQLEKPIEVEADGITVPMLLDQICRQAGISWQLRHGVILLATPDRMTKLPGWTPWDHLALEAKRIDATFDATPLADALTFVTAASGAKFTVSEKLKTIEVSLEVNDVTVSDLLALLLVPHDATVFETAGGAYRIVDR